MKTTNFKEDKKATYIFMLLVGIILVAPFVLTIYLSVPSADDYTEALTVMGKGNHFIASIREANVHWMTWMGQWPDAFLMKFINPLTLSNGKHITGIVLVVTFLIMTAMLFFFVKVLMEQFLDVCDFKLICTTYLVLLFAFLNTDIYFEIYYWFVGNQYLWELVAILLNGIMIIKFFKNPNVKNGVLLAIVGFVACFGYQYDLSVGVFYILAFFSTRHDNKKISVWNRLYPLAFMIIGGCLSVFAPGNFQRHSHFEEGMQIKSALVDSFSTIASCYTNIAGNAIFVIALVISFELGLSANGKIKKVLPFAPVYLIVGQLIGVFGAVFCVALGYGPSFYGLSNRMEFIADGIITIWSVLTAFTFGLYFRERGTNKDGVKGMGVSRTIIMFALIINAVLTNSENNALLSIPWVKTAVLLPEITTESGYYRAILSNIEQSDDSKVVVIDRSSSIPDITGVLKPIGITDNENDWVNRAMAKWYGKESVTYIID